MATTIIGTIQRFQGLSTDAKPDAPPEGSTYHAVDTGKMYIYYNGTWEQDIRIETALAGVF